MLIGENCAAFLCIAPKERERIGLPDENTPLKPSKISRIPDTG